MFYEKLKGKVPEDVYNELPVVIEVFNLNTPLRLAHFLSQAAHESGGFKFTVENLNYSSAGLMSVFKKYFPTQSEADLFARKPEKIANRVYGGRMGNTAQGDGWKYRGRGYIQLTGKDNYAVLNDYLRKAGLITADENVLTNPDLVATRFKLTSAAFFFHVNVLEKICDMGSSYDVCKRLTRAVNGGYHGLEDRWQRFQYYWAILK